MDAKTVTRESLYEEVWTTPLTKLADSYGVSNVALAKVCRKLNVPVPGRGYWAKVAAGHSVKRWPLPGTAKHHVTTIKPRRRRADPPPPEPFPQVETESRFTGLKVPERVTRSHPLTAKTRHHFAELQRRVARAAKRRPGVDYGPEYWPPWEQNGRYQCGGDEGYRLTISFDALERALRFMDTLVKALTKEGFRIDVRKVDTRQTNSRQLGGLVASKDGEVFGFLLREGYTRRERTAKELAEAKRDHSYVTKYESLPNGMLTFEFIGEQWGLDRTFPDGKTIKLEAEIRRIVATFVDGVARQKAIREEREQAARESREREHREWLERDRVRKEKEMVTKFLDEANLDDRFAKARLYLTRLTAAAHQGGELTDERRAWLVRMRELLDAFDPMIERLKSPRLSPNEGTDEADS